METNDNLAARVLELERRLSEKTLAEEKLRQSEQKYRLVIDGTSQGFLMLDRNLAVTDLNRAVVDMLGYSRDELLGKGCYDLYEPNSVEFHYADRNHLSFEVTLLAKTGRKIPMLFSRSTLREESGEMIGYLAFLTELTELRLAEEERRRAELLYENMYRNAVQGMFQSALSGKILRANPAFGRLLGFEDPEEIIGREGADEWIYPRVDDRRKMISDLRERGALSNYELELRRKDGSLVWVIANVRLAADEGGEPIIEGMLLDNTARKIAEDKLRRSEERFRFLAEHDALTGLYNRRYLYENLGTLLNQRDTQLSLVFMDLDNFKSVVDMCGHLHGSRVIQEVAGTIRGALHEPAYGVSYAGDEFVFVLPGMKKEQALEMVKGLRRRIAETDYLTIEGLKVNLTASFGIANFPEDAADVTGLLAEADRALFDVKARGRNAIGVMRNGLSTTWQA